MNKIFRGNNFHNDQILYIIPNSVDYYEIDNTNEKVRRPSLKLGDQGDDVLELQKYLIKLNYLSGTPDGIFGFNTERAVRNFQKDYNILINGVVGNNTWVALENTIKNPIPTSRPTIKEGDKNFYVKEAQLKLQILGFFEGNPNGIFESDTTTSVKEFQQRRNLTIDGIIGPNTWREINRSFSASEIPTPSLRPTIKLGDQNDDVKLLQRMLRALNYEEIEETGIFDEQTKALVMSFQTTRGIPATGIVDQHTWEALEQAILLPNNVLKEGDTGDNVIIIQDKLKILDYYQGSITGSFGPETTASVMGFQKDTKIPVTGIVDQNTLRDLYKETEKFIITPPSVINRPTLRLGDQGNDVSDLQELLKQLMFYNGEVNGNFDNATNVAVRTFQTNNKLTSNGIVDQNTWSALIYLYSPLAICRDINQKFKGVVIDPGHGGSDPGAVSKDIIEKEYTLKISQYMANRFRELGVPFSMTRDSDITLSREERIRRMKAPFGDVSDAIVISNHINAGGGEGAEVIYALRNTPNLAQSILDEIGKAGQKKRSVYQRKLPEDPSKDYYYIMRDTSKLQTTLVEYGFLDNANDVARLQKYWDKYAEATVKAVTEYMGYSYSLPGAGKVKYIVRAGDTLFSIANRFNTTVDAIKTLNNLTSNTLTIGQELLIPGEGIDETPPSGNIVYIVKAGDSLWSIAQKFNTTVEELRRINNLTSDTLSIGQQLFVPGVSIEIPETNPTVYTVQLGDTLYSIANKFNATVQNLITWNNLTSNTLTIGQRLIVSQNTGQDYFIYTVVKGDSLYNIANRFNTTIQELRRINNLTSDLLSIGQQLKIPGSTNNTFTYTVVRGDSLWLIANRFNTTVEEIKRLNNLTNNTLQIGQVLLIPNV